MAGLLDFALGFGAGAAGAVAQDRASQLEMQRKANLERLRAQYATQQQEAGFERVAGFLEQAETGTPEEQSAARRQLVARGVTIPQPPGMDSPAGRAVSDAFRLRQQGRNEEADIVLQSALSTASEPERIQIANAVADARGIPRGTPEYANLLETIALRPSSVTTIDLGTTGQAETEKELAKGEARSFLEMQEVAARSRRMGAEVTRLEAGLDAGRFITGEFSNQRLFLSRLGSLAGVNSEELSPLLGSAASAEDMDAAANLIAAYLFQEVAAGTGTPRSNAMLNLIKDAGPSLSRTPEGNRLIVEVARRKITRDQEIANLADYYIRNYRSFRPEDTTIPSFYTAVAQLDEDDPIVTDDLRERIMTARDNAPTRDAAWSGQQQAMQSLPRITGTTREAIFSQFESAGIKVGDTFIDDRPNSETYGQTLVRRQ